MIHLIFYDPLQIHTFGTYLIYMLAFIAEYPFLERLIYIFSERREVIFYTKG